MTMATNKRAQDLVQKGKEALQHHHLSNAEKLFLAALQCLPNDNSDDPLAYEAYHGLAQTYSKKGRYCRNDEKEWHRYYLQSLYMYRQAVQLAPTEVKRTKVKEELSPVQEIYCQCLETRLFPAPPPSRSHRGKPRAPPKMNIRWLEELKDHIVTKLAAVQQNGRESVSSSDSSLPEEPVQPQVEEQNKRRLDFNRVRKAIMRMVKVISTDMRSRYIRKRLSQDTLKQAVSSEMLCMLTPENENMDVVSLFESYIVEEDPEFEVDQAPQAKQSSTESESDENMIGNDRDVPQHVVTPLCSIRESYAVPRIYHHINSNRQSVDSDVKLNGILRVWKGHNENNTQQPTNFVPHKMNFEECSPLTENTNYSFQDTQEGPEIVVVSEQNIEITLAALLSKIADKFSADNKFVAADELYTYALGIYQRHKDSMPSQEGKAVAHLLNSIGKVRCRKGDMIGGAHLMEKSVDLYRRFHGEEEHVDIITVWYELGRAFIYEQSKEDSLLDYVMKTVKSRVDLTTKNSKKLDDEMMDYVSESEDSDDESEDSYLLNIHEAKLCFNHALRMLRNLRRSKNEIHTKVYVEVLSKLADCCVMLGDYQRATLCYEEALVLFKNVISSSSVLPLNSHVLTMLGVTNFLVGNYPKAVTMLETAHILQQHLQDPDATKDKAFTLTMLGITNHIAGQYYKCVAWCLKAHEMYVVLFPDLSKLSSLQCWFIIQNVYMLGYAYSFLNLNEQALYYLELSHDMAHTTLQDDVSHTEQIVHILKLIADVYVALDRSSEALEFYEKAHEYSVKLGDDQRSNTLHNQLLNCMAGLHITSKNYNTAAECLEQALDYQENLQDSIKGDMFGMLHSLGLTYTFSGDIDKAISCYKDAIETYHEDIHGGSAGPEIAGILGRLATLYHVKMCLEEDEHHEMNLCQEAEQNYQEASSLDPCSPVVVQFANFQYQQAQTPEALLTMIDFLRRSTIPSTVEVVYNGPEQAVLPSHLQFDVDEVDEVALNAKIFGHFLAILCYKELHLMKDAEDSLVELYHLVYQTSVALNFSILGYGLMELELLEEAAEAFCIAFHLDSDSTNALVNVWLCLAAAAYKALSRAVSYVIEHSFLPFKAATPRLRKPVKSEDSFTKQENITLAANKPTTGKSLDSSIRQQRVSTVKDITTAQESRYPRWSTRHTNVSVTKEAEKPRKSQDQNSSTTKDEVSKLKDTPKNAMSRDQNNSARVEFESVVVFNYNSPKPTNVHLKPAETKSESIGLNGNSSIKRTETKESVERYRNTDYKERPSIHQHQVHRTANQQEPSSLQSRQIHTKTQNEVRGAFGDRSRRSPVVAMDISPDDVSDSRDQWDNQDTSEPLFDESEEDGPNAEVLDEMLKSSEEIEAELHDVLRHIDAVQNKSTSSTTDWRSNKDSATDQKTNKNSDWRTGGRSYDWRTGKYIKDSTNSTNEDSSNSNQKADSDGRTGGLSYDWRTGKQVRDSVNKASEDKTNSNGKTITDSDQRSGGLSYDWRIGRHSSRSSTERTDPDGEADNKDGWRTEKDFSWRRSPDPDTNPPAVTGWRAATSSRTQEILLSIQNNNLGSKKKVEEPPQPKQEEEEEWQVWEEEEVVETPPEILAAILTAQKRAA